VSDEIAKAHELGAKITDAFALAVQDAAREHAAAGVATVGVDAAGNIVRRDPDGTRTIVGSVASEGDDER
jgi:hypothetical protein